MKKGQLNKTKWHHACLHKNDQVFNMNNSAFQSAVWMTDYQLKLKADEGSQNVKILLSNTNSQFVWRSFLLTPDISNCVFFILCFICLFLSPAPLSITMPHEYLGSLFCHCQLFQYLTWAICNSAYRLSI
jgi:hypothetical protein